ncbi:reticulocalbin-1-like [Pezoporus flaviventris]|uniref:reticulocalbin-1-like n=1 Tax=Pezoporus flaviventris TaxID=889875 RepID=UPI002AB1B35D|nr:reticulocalbin-1-like [Pezoporus flaviventris]
MSGRAGEGVGEGGPGPPRSCHRKRNNVAGGSQWQRGAGPPTWPRRLLIGGEGGGGAGTGRTRGRPPEGAKRDGARCCWGSLACGCCCWAGGGGAWGAPPPPSLGHDPDHVTGFGPDHEAFLGGGEEAREFERLRPEESRRRLRLLLPRVDADGDAALSAPELRSWMERGRRRSRARSAERALREHDRDRDRALTWDEFSSEAYGAGPLGAPSRRQRARDERRFRAADGDGDGAVAGAELEAFLHPGDFERMRGVVVMETIEDLDKNGDGLIQEDEYIGRAADGGRGPGQLGDVCGEPGHQLWGGPGAPPR